MEREAPGEKLRSPASSRLSRLENDTRPEYDPGQSLVEINETDGRKTKLSQAGQERKSLFLNKLLEGIDEDDSRGRILALKKGLAAVKEARQKPRNEEQRIYMQKLQASLNIRVVNERRRINKKQGKQTEAAGYVVTEAPILETKKDSKTAEATPEMVTEPTIITPVLTEPRPSPIQGTGTPDPSSTATLEVPEVGRIVQLVQGPVIEPNTIPAETSVESPWARLKRLEAAERLPWKVINLSSRKVVTEEVAGNGHRPLETSVRLPDSKRGVREKLARVSVLAQGLVGVGMLALCTYLVSSGAVEVVDRFLHRNREKPTATQEWEVKVAETEERLSEPTKKPSEAPVETEAFPDRKQIGREIEAKKEAVNRKEYSLGEFDLTQPFTLTLPDEKGMVTLTPVVSEEQDSLLKVARELTDWKTKPEMAGIIPTAYSNQFMVLCHSYTGEKGEPLPCDDFRLNDFAGKNLVVTGLNEHGEIVRVETRVGERKTVTYEGYKDAIKYGEEPGEPAYIDAEQLGVSGEPGLVILVCDGDRVYLGPGEKEGPNYSKRTLVPLTIESQQVLLDTSVVREYSGSGFTSEKVTGFASRTIESGFLFSGGEQSMFDPRIEHIATTDENLREAMRLAVMVDRYKKEAAEGEGLGTYMVDHWQYTGPFNNEVKSVQETIINPYSYDFSNGERGMQCLGWVALRTAEDYGLNPRVYIGGDTIGGPGGAIPELIKQAAALPIFQEKQVGGRTFLTGEIDVTDLGVGDQLLFSNSGIMNNDGVDPGHGAVVEWSGNYEGKPAVVISEANADKTGEVSLTLVTSQSELENLFGPNIVVLVNTADD